MRDFFQLRKELKEDQFGTFFIKFEVIKNTKKVEEATDVFNKYGIQITRTALKGGLGFQINYGERGRYIQVLSKDMNNLMKAMQTAMKAK